MRSVSPTETYAAASGDFNRIHLDKEVAQAVGLPGNILHGMCTMAWAAEAAIDALGGDPGDLKSLQVRFSRPVKIDDRISRSRRELGTDPAVPGSVFRSRPSNSGMARRSSRTAVGPTHPWARSSLMAVDPQFKGRSYGPYRYEVGLEKIRAFAGASSSTSRPSEAARHSPKQLRPIYHDLEAGQASRHGSVVAPPTFCVNFAMAPFLEAAVDPELGIDLSMLLHGEQALRVFRCGASRRRDEHDRPDHRHLRASPEGLRHRGQ